MSGWNDSGLSSKSFITFTTISIKQRVGFDYALCNHVLPLFNPNPYLDNQVVQLDMYRYSGGSVRLNRSVRTNELPFSYENTLDRREMLFLLKRFQQRVNNLENPLSSNIS